SSHVRADSHGTSPAGFHVSDLLVEPQHGRKHHSSVRDHQFSAVSRRYAPRPPDEQHCSDDVFSFSQPPCDDRLGNVKFSCGAGNGAVFRYGKYQTQMSELETSIEQAAVVKVHFPSISVSYAHSGIP